MKKTLNFWQSLEKYSWKLVGRSPLPWPYIGVGIVGLILLVSALNVKDSVVGATSMEEVIEKAAKNGDYLLAEQLYTREGTQVLGANNELEDLVYPERVVLWRIAELEAKLEMYPGNREIYLSLATLYGEIGNEEQRERYWEQARILEPNDPIFQP